ncbi:hypothetical protein [Epilithonimonas sp. UC225_85]|uniref:hypothetical protein n=1 Tax=Epilithonimonas sp. UC225_85 TaxID=3350167 RepID=UPI0036D258C0
MANLLMEMANHILDLTIPSLETTYLLAEMANLILDLAIPLLEMAYLILEIVCLLSATSNIIDGCINRINFIYVKAQVANLCYLGVI